MLALPCPPIPLLPCHTLHLHNRTRVYRVIREYVIAHDAAKIKLTIQALVSDFVYSVSANARNGGLIGLAATSISLGPVRI